MIGVVPPHDLAAQEIAAVRIAQRQRLAMRAVASEKPALEVHAPHVVGCTAMRKGYTRGRTAAPQAALNRQTLPIEQRPDRARCRPLALRDAPDKPRSHLRRSPGGMRAPYRQAPLGDRLYYRVRMVERRSRALDESFNASLIVSPKPLVAGLAADSEAPTHRRERLFSLLNRHHKAHPFVHSMGLRPSHRQGPPCRSVDLLPMSSVYSVTHVPGLDPPNPSLKGEGSRPSLPLALALFQRDSAKRRYSDERRAMTRRDASCTDR